MVPHGSGFGRHLQSSYRTGVSMVVSAMLAMAAGRQPARGAWSAQCVSAGLPAVPQIAVIQVCQVLSSSRCGWWRTTTALTSATPRWECWVNAARTAAAKASRPAVIRPCSATVPATSFWCLAFHGHLGQELAGDA